MVVKRGSTEYIPLRNVGIKVPEPDYLKWQALRGRVEKKIREGKINESDYLKLSEKFRAVFKEYIADLENLDKNGQSMR